MQLPLLSHFSHVQPHRRQPTRLPRPWGSPGKNTGVGCHFLLQCMKVKSEREVAQLCLTLSNPMDCSLPGSSVHGIFQASTRVGCHCLLRQSPSTYGKSDAKQTIQFDQKVPLSKISWAYFCEFNSLFFVLFCLVMCLFFHQYQTELITEGIY